MTSLNFNNNEKAIDDFFADFLEYRKSRQVSSKNIKNLAAANKETKKFIDISEVKETVMPKPLESIESIEDLTVDRYTVKLLYNRLSEQLLPYIEQVVADWDYEGSPIYDVEVGRDAIGTLTDKVIYLAKDDIPEVKQILLSEKFGDWSENEMLRSIVEAILINVIFIEQRVKNPFVPNKNTTNPNQPQMKKDNSDTLYDMEEFI